MNKIRDDWTNGLSTMFANALKGHGFKSKEEVKDAFEKGLIHMKNYGGGCTVYSLGKVGINEVKLWLGMDIEKKKPRTEKQILAGKLMKSKTAIEKIVGRNFCFLTQEQADKILEVLNA